MLTDCYFLICCLRYSLYEQKYHQFWQWFVWEVSVPVLFEIVLSIHQLSIIFGGTKHGIALPYTVKALISNQQLRAMVKLVHFKVRHLIDTRDLKHRQRHGTTTTAGSNIFPRERSAHVRCCQNVVLPSSTTEFARFSVQVKT